MSQSMNPSHQMLSAGGAMVTDVLSFVLMSIVHGLAQPVRQSPCKLRQRERVSSVSLFHTISAKPFISSMLYTQYLEIVLNNAESRLFITS